MREFTVVVPDRDLTVVTPERLWSKYAPERGLTITVPKRYLGYLKNGVRSKQTSTSWTTWGQTNIIIGDQTGTFGDYP